MRCAIIKWWGGQFVYNNNLFYSFLSLSVTRSMSVGRIIVFSNSNIQRYQSMGIFEDYTCIAVSLYSLFPRIGLTWPKGRGHSMPQRPIRTRYQLWCATRVFGCHHTLAHVIEWNVVRTMAAIVIQAKGTNNELKMNHRQNRTEKKNTQFNGGAQMGIYIIDRIYINLNRIPKLSQPNWKVE